MTLDSNPAGISFTLIETDDPIDSMTDIGEDALLIFTGFPGFNDKVVTIVALTAEGPIVEFSDGTFNLLTDNSSLTSGTALATTATGTFPYCFAVGTMIDTPDGQRAVEALEIGEMVLTLDGGSVPVKWIGRQALHKRTTSFEKQLVCIRAGALGQSVPCADLTVTADHGMVIDGYVVNAAALVNGSTIDFVPMAELPDGFTVYHIETEDHDVILANGAPSETFIDYRARSHFDNHDEYLELYGAERIIPEMPRPRISSARMLPKGVRARLGLDEVELPLPSVA
jgi:hypothetical protein